MDAMLIVLVEKLSKKTTRGIFRGCDKGDNESLDGVIGVW